jgi:RHS repeat-associated protein
VVTEASGAVVSRKDFAAFGDETITSQRTSGLGYNIPDIRQDYTGYLKDNESGLEYAQARYYNSQHGRFTSVDPMTASATVRNPQSLNRYDYVLNSPYKFTDPLGLVQGYNGSNGCSAQYSDCIGYDSGLTIPGVTVGTWDRLTSEQQRLFTSYYVHAFGGGQEHATSCVKGPCYDSPTDEEMAATYWNASVVAANNGDSPPSAGLTQDQLTTFIGVTSMWEYKHVSDKIRVVTDIVKDTGGDGFRLLGTFAPGGGEYIRDHPDEWHKTSLGGKGKYKYSYRERSNSEAPNGQFAITENFQDFNSDVDYHPPNWKNLGAHPKHENSDIRQNHGGVFYDHYHFRDHVNRYGHVAIEIRQD